MTNPPRRIVRDARHELGAHGAGGAVGIPYKSDDYEAARKRKRGKQGWERRCKRSQTPESIQEGGAGVPGRTLGGPKGQGVVGEYSYKELGPVPLQKSDEAIEKPFRPSHPMKKGYNGTLDKFPKYMEDPLDLKLAKEKAERMAEIKKLAGGAPFVPPSTTKTAATASVLRMNLK